MSSFHNLQPSDADMKKMQDEYWVAKAGPASDLTKLKVRCQSQGHGPASVACAPAPSRAARGIHSSLLGQTLRARSPCPAQALSPTQARPFCCLWIG